MTKTKGEIAELSVVLEGISRGWEVLRPVVDTLKYDLLFEINNTFLRIQVKWAWYDKSAKRFVVDNRKIKTNRRDKKVVSYKKEDFEYAIIFVNEPRTFYIIPSSVFTKYASSLSFDPRGISQRPAKTAKYKNAWDLLDNI